MKNILTMKVHVAFLAIVLFCTLLISCKKERSDGDVTEKEAAPKEVYLDHKRPVEERVADLISKMTLEEKISQLTHHSDSIPRLNIPQYNWWNEALHGVARAGRATVFPQAIGLGATFDDSLMFQVATAISDEARAKYNAAVKKGNRLRYGGLTFWTPNVNIFRDPRWGRGQETYGEDPYLTSQLGVAFVKGLQGDDPNYLKAAACAKHYVVHSGPEKDRHTFDAVASAKDMNETYFPAFHSLVDAGVEAVMCAYNRTNGEACCGSKTLLVDVLRDQWGFKGHIVSDCWAIVDFHEGHKITNNIVESAALAMNSGVDLNCGDEYPHLLEAVKQGLVTEETINKALTKLFITRFKLGMFDPEELNPYSKISTDVIDSDEHRTLAREAAVKSIVLLKNQNNVLPLKKDIRYLFITGPNASTTEVLIGNYYGLSSRMVTILEGLTGKVEDGSLIQYKQGALLDRENINPIDWTTSDAQEADAIVAVLGISGLLEGEEGESIASHTKGDRFEMNIPKNQIEFLRKLKKDNTKPVIAVITGGSPMDLTEVHTIADAVLFVWYPGEEGGNAVADIIFGDRSPSGRLPITFPASLSQLPPYEDYSMKGRTYKYMEEVPMYPFGFGLSYTQFDYSGLKVNSATYKGDGNLQITVTVTNKGAVEAEEVVQLYLTHQDAPFTTPLYSLKGFKRVNLKAGESKDVTFELTKEAVSVVNDEGDLVLQPGKMKVFAGGSLPGKRSQELGAPAVEELIFEVKK